MDALRRVIEAAPDAVLLIDEQGVIQEANQHVEEVLGYTPDELRGSVVEELLMQSDRENHVGYREAYTDDPEPRPMGQELDLEARRKDGRAVPVEISLGPIEQDGRLLIKATIADVSRRRAMEEQLRNQAEHLEELIGIVSHDLRNPLTVVQGWIDLAKEEDDVSYLSNAEHALERMRDIVDDTLTLAKWGVTVEEVDEQPLSLAGMAQECWSVVETDGARLDVGDDVSISADPGRLRHFFENLFRNAVEHAGPAPVVRTGALENSTGFFVEDDGPGLPERNRDKLFDAGYTTDAEGTGFGLAIVNRVATAHGWELGVTESVSGGARFEVRFEAGGE